jgi:hypothetical protein
MMDKRDLSKPSLRITRNEHHDPSSDFVFDVWNPLTGTYQRADSFDNALRRLEVLCSLLHQMWLHEHRSLAALKDAPDAPAADGTAWSEFRISPKAIRSYETRHADRPAWTKATGGKAQAIQTTCRAVGFVRQAYMMFPGAGAAGQAPAHGAPAGPTLAE